MLLDPKTVSVARENFWSVSGELLGILDDHGRLEALNAAWKETLGHSPDELATWPLLELVHPDDREKTRALLDRANQETGLIAFENRCRCRNDSYKWISWRLLAAAERNVRHIAGRDISREKELEQELLHVQKISQIGRLTMSVAHDFNGLLTIILGCADILRAAPGIATQHLKDVEDIHGAARHGVELVESLIDFCRKKTPKSPDSNLNETIGTLEPLLRRLIRGNIRIDFALAPIAGRVKVNKSQLEQILLNLVCNARDAMPQGGRIGIETAYPIVEGALNVASGSSSKPVPCVLLAVTDTGNGMSPELQARIFEPFFTTKKPGKGTGLGLATVRDIVAQAGGQIQVRSRPGQGTTFLVYLPLTVPRSDGLI